MGRRRFTPMTEIIAQVPWQVTPKVSNPRTAIELLIILPEGRRGFFRDQMALYSALKRSGRPRLAPQETSWLFSAGWRETSPFLEGRSGLPDPFCRLRSPPVPSTAFGSGERAGAFSHREPASGSPARHGARSDRPPGSASSGRWPRCDAKRLRGRRGA